MPRGRPKNKPIESPPEPPKPEMPKETPKENVPEIKEESPTQKQLNYYLALYKTLKDEGIDNIGVLEVRIARLSK